MRYFRSRDEDEIIEGDPATLQHELEQAEQTIHNLMRQISREQARCAEVLKSYNNVVANLVSVSRDNGELERERDSWRQRVERVRNADYTVHLSAAEINAIRKAMARLHHPDTGGDSERMKLWNMVLDQLEQ